MPWLLVFAGSMGMFAATATGSSRSPFLPDMAADFSVSLPAIANLFGLTAATWGLSSYIVGAASDKFGRQLFLVVAPFFLALSMVGASLSSSYLMFVGTVAMAAVCCGAFTATIMAQVSLNTAETHQGRALGIVMSGQSLTLLIGVPIAAWLGASIGWRGVHLALSGLALFAFTSICFALNRQSADAKDEASKRRAKPALREVITGPILRLFLSMIAERLCFGLATFYYASYLRTVYELPLSAVAIPLALFAAGNIVGTLLGGPLADRFPYRRVCLAINLLIAGAIAWPWFFWQANVQVTISLGIAFAFFNALARPSILAALADVPAHARGVVMGLNSSIASIGWLLAALIGGWLYISIGFAGFGPVMALMSCVAALIVLPDSRIRNRHTQ